jgi:hypothetical protein
MTDINIDEIIKKIKYLKALREELLQKDLAPQGAWIHQYQVHCSYPNGHEATYTYAKWQADKPIFKRNPKKNARPLKCGKDKEYTTHQHIGNIETDPEVQEAYKCWDNRKQLEHIEKIFKNIEVMLYSLTLPNCENTDDLK